MIGEAFAAFYFLCILLSIFFFSQLDQGRKLEGVIGLENYPKVSIIIPARNEERNIRNCLKSMDDLDYPDYEVIVVDGNSTDGTKEIVRNEFPHFKLIEEPPRPEGWVGKPWACHVGFQHASGSVLLFTDADTIHNKDTLRVLVPRLLKETDGFLTIVTKLVMKKFWEYTLVIIFQMVAMSVLGARGSKGRYMANGQFIMFTRDAYVKIGGHEKVRNAVIEDMELASASASVGIVPAIYDVPNLVSVRMYRKFSELVEGFSKNLAAGAKTLGIGPFLRVNLVHVWATGWFILLIAGYYLPSSRNLLFISAAVGYATYSLVCIFGEYQLSKKITWHMVFFPIYFNIYQYIIMKSFILVYGKKKVVWKGLEYSVQ